LRIGYYWPSNFRDSYKFVQACIECQKMLAKKKKMLCLCNQFYLTFLFLNGDWISLDLLILHLLSSHIFILTTTEYFTKWTEAIPLKHAQDEHVISFLESNIFSHFGLPIKIIFNNGPTFISGKLTQFLNKLGVNHFTSSTYYPQGNGQAESTNKNMVKC
jgi:transposase InsO family protein